MTENIDSDGSSSSAETDLILKRRLVGKELDTLCAAGRWWGTAFLPVASKARDEICKALGVTAFYMPVGTSTAERKKEMNTPRAIPIDTYNPKRPHAFWKRAMGYSEQHEGDTDPRLFAIVETSDMESFQRTKQGVMEQHADDPKILNKADLPVFGRVSKRSHLKPQLFESMLEGDVQGLILRRPKHLEIAREEWYAFLKTQENPALIARPFMGLEGSAKELLEIMKKGEIEADTLVLQDTPDIETALQMRVMHLKAMRKRKKSKKLNNPFANPDRQKTRRFAIINVQGGARRDAIALMEASRHMNAFNVEVHLVENGEQLKSADPHAIVFPGGWHRNQFDAQAALGINSEVVDYIRKGVHMLALCAGCIQTRRADNELDRIRSEGCATGTTFGIGDYAIRNNVLSDPHDVLIALHKDGDPDAKTAVISKSIPFSNGPEIIGVNEQELEVIARISTDERAAHIDDDNGGIVGVQVLNTEVGKPVHMAFSFHDSIAFLLALGEIDIYDAKIAHSQLLRGKRTDLKQSEYAILGLNEQT